jgi:single-strand DNA-binding protein
MGSVNKVILVGNLGRDAEMRFTPGWGKQAETLSQYLVKGKQVYLEGRLQTDEYTDKEGQKRKSTRVRCDRVVLLGGGPRGGGGMEREPVHSGVPAHEPVDVPEDDIPF